MSLVFILAPGFLLLAPDYGFPFSFSLSLLLPEEPLPPLLELLPELLPGFLEPGPLVPEPFVGGFQEMRLRYAASRVELDEGVEATTIHLAA